MVAYDMQNIKEMTKSEKRKKEKKISPRKKNYSAVSTQHTRLLINAKNMVNTSYES